MMLCTVCVANRGWMVRVFAGFKRFKFKVRDTTIILVSISVSLFYLS
jgi:hypothetical protein